MDFSCNTCGVACADREALRRHYDGDLHADNVKRRVNGLVPLSAQAHGARSRAATSMQSISYKCTICDKRFATAQTLNSHIQSQKHKEMKAKRKLEKQEEEAKDEPEESPPADEEDAASDDVQDEAWEASATRIPESEDLTPADCAFCNIRAPSLEDLLCHMAKAHNFSFPLAERIIDVNALLECLVSKANTGVCLVCGEEGRVFETRLGVQDHMAAKGHQMIKLSGGFFDEYYQRLPDFATPAGPEGEAPIEYALPNGKVVVSKHEIKTREAAPMYRDTSDFEQRLLIEQKPHLNVQNMHRYQEVLAQLQTREMKKEKRVDKRRTREEQKQRMRLGVHLNCLHTKGYQGDYVGNTM